MHDVGLGAAQTALMRMLRPIVKLMIHLGLPLQSFVEVLKATYVEVAERNFAEDGRPLTDSQVSVLTGVHRKDVRRLRAEPLQADALTPSLAMQVAMAWTGISDLLDEDGLTKPLPRRNARRADGTELQPGDKTFDDLVESLTSDVSATAVLKDMLRQNMVEEVGQDVYNLATSWLVNDEKLSDKISVMSLNVHDRIDAGVQNAMYGNNFHRIYSVYSKAVSPDIVERMKDMLDKDGEKLMHKLNTRVVQGEQALLAGQPAVRMSCGFYIYSEPLNTR
ncbi:MAG: DUF6502 family protein [Burkholderiaceae bacterium]